MAEIGEVQVASIRSLDDFLLESARFQIPNFKDLEKWNNRVYQNLLYYQTNYFLTYFAVFLLVGLLHPTQMLCGTIAVGAAGGFFYFITSNQQGALSFKKSHPLLFVISLFALAGFVVYLLGSIATFLLGILLPIVVIFVHASLRLRNLRNKVLNKLEWTGLRRSPMGVLLETIGWEQEISMEMKKYVEERAKIAFLRYAKLVEALRNLQWNQILGFIRRLLFVSGEELLEPADSRASVPPSVPKAMTTVDRYKPVAEKGKIITPRSQAYMKVDADHHRKPGVVVHQKSVFSNVDGAEQREGDENISDNVPYKCSDISKRVQSLDSVSKLIKEKSPRLYPSLGDSSYSLLASSSCDTLDADAAFSAYFTSPYPDASDTSPLMYDDGNYEVAGVSDDERKKSGLRQRLNSKIRSVSPFARK